jgi:hypothetical protein
MEVVMAHDASQLLGAQQLAGTTVNPRGYGWKEGAGVAGVAIGHAAAKRASENDSTTPEFPRIAFLAVTDQEIALIKIGSGGMNGKLDEVLARIPRDEIASAKVSRGVLRTNLTISFTGGGDWEFEVSPLIRQKVVQVVHAMGY